ncbi:hypothetical protein [Streptomyces sp. NBC_00299]|uniref:hypothetical protein n=1 Tax=Streptomyces sp. NBC_00299 TaxID=2975705 RepID=UPI002E28D5D8|nr:hypothetical protein [Streptomyces sp. NBC_00299]
MKTIGGALARMTAGTVMVLLLVAGCGEKDGTDAAGSVGAGPSLDGAPNKPWTEAELNEVALSDRDGYEVSGRVPMSARPSTRTADPAMCSPILQALGKSSSTYAAGARIGRIFSSEGSGSGATMTLASHRMADARAAVAAFRTAAEKCTAFRDVEQSYDYEAVEARLDPGYGDESVSLRLVQVVSYPDGESLRVPFAVVVARKGATVGTFYDFNPPSGVKGVSPASVPDDLVRVQLDKLGQLDTAE